MSMFVVAVLVGTVLFADRIIPAEEVRRRFYQVGLALAAVVFVFGLSALVFRSEDLSGDGFDAPDGVFGSILRDRFSLIVGAAFVLLLAGFYQSAAFPTIATGSMLAGLVLLVTSVGDSASGSLIQLYYELRLDGDGVNRAIFVAVTGIGLAMLIAYGLREWDRPPGAPELEGEAADLATG